MKKTEMIISKLDWDCGKCQLTITVYYPDKKDIKNYERFAKFMNKNISGVEIIFEFIYPPIRSWEF